MTKKNSSKRNGFLKDISTSPKKITLPIAIFVLILSGCLTYNKISTKEITNKESKFISDSDNKVNVQDHYDADSNNEAQDIRLAHAGNLVNNNVGVPVLYYHSINESADNEVTMTPEMLKKQLQYIKDQGYITLTISELKDYLLKDAPIPKNSIVITFDDGYMDNYRNAFPILKNLNMVATIFCITSNLDGSYYLSKDAISEMSHYGIDIESHTVTHPKLNKLTYDDQLKELSESKKTLESITGKEVTSIAYPFGNFNDDTIKAAKTAGYTLGFTTNRGLSDRNDNPLKLDRIYVSSKYNMETFKEILSKTEK
ncbi:MULTISPECIES: polysaccharide deacetylase family protein [unclassified Clostridium]|uniref:polysaccharide deacetylase family protein n=1 Tax=unclassified Clostridium TaxID=2614128 RepID=UPI000297E96D|nr:MULTISPECIES: polysaccharide deacetylase family protein [unclassified Clostridium]EKQ52259.1 MAG: putative xylanase/chitin deacetylase [Clostridium sp. Maddingley MBC34-26]